LALFYQTPKTVALFSSFWGFSFIVSDFFLVEWDSIRAFTEQVVNTPTNPFHLNLGRESLLVGVGRDGNCNGKRITGFVQG